MIIIKNQNYMKTNYLFKARWLVAVIAILTFGVRQVHGAEGDVNYTLSFTQLSAGSNNESYTADHTITVSSKKWTVRGNQTLGTFLGVGGKNTSATDRVMKSTSAIGSKIIGKVRVTTGGTGGTGTMTFSKLKLEVSTKSDFSDIIDTKTNNSPVTSGNMDFTPTSSYWPAGCYYRITYTYKTTDNTKNKYFKVNSVTFYEGAIPTCTGLTMTSVTATPGNTQIALSWPAVTNADSYNVTCKVKSSGAAAGTAGSVTGTTTKSCTITGLTNGTVYTWSVEPVGSGDYCDTNTPATGDATPNVVRTITYYDKDGSHIVSLTEGTNIAAALTALYGAGGPTSCNTDDYEYFVGWGKSLLPSTGSTDIPDILTSEVVNSTTAASAYYAVWSDKTPWNQTTSVAKDDKVIIAQIDDDVVGTAEMVGFNTTVTTGNNYGTYESFTTTPAGTMIWTVEDGSASGQVAFKNGSYYLNLSSANNYLNGSTTKNAYSSWTVTTSSSRAQVNNVQFSARKIMWNKSSPRFACYEKNHGNNSGTYYYYIVFYKLGGNSATYITSCCDDVITLNTPTITGTGCSIAFDESSPVETCSDAKDVTASLTVTNGYKVTALSFTLSAGTYTIDPAISTPYTSSQDFTLSFAQNHAAATLTTTATVEALHDKYKDYLHGNATIDKEGNYGTAPSLSSQTAATSAGCKDNHYKFKGWVAEADVNTDGTLKGGYTLILGGATGKYATGATYIAVWAEEVE